MKQGHVGKNRNCHREKCVWCAAHSKRVTREYAAMLLRKAFDAGITFFDTAPLTATARKKIGLRSAMQGKADSGDENRFHHGGGFLEGPETSLSLLKADYIDITVPNQFLSQARGRHRPVREAMLEAWGTGEKSVLSDLRPSPDVAEGGSALRPDDTLQFPLLLSVHRKGHCPGKKLCQELNLRLYLP